MKNNDINSYNVDEYVYRKKIYELNKEINEKNNKITELLQELDNTSNLYNSTRELLEQQNYKLNKIYNNKLYKFVKPYRTFIKRIRNKNVVDSGKLVTNNEKEEIENELVDNDVDFNLLSYHSHYEDNYDFTKGNYSTDIKALAFYLPQFYCFKENDEWWGKGFTEWTNTKKALPRFQNHYQPREPHEDIGYYRLDNVETIKNQVKLAKQHGIFGFCLYYYWFSGKRIMNVPGDLFLNDSSIDFPFCLCWANESFARNWCGLDSEILMEQKYNKKDPERFIKDIKKYLMDKRYIRVDGKPLLLVYNPREIKNFNEVIKIWRNDAIKLGIGELEIWSKNDIGYNTYNNTDFVDGEFDFAPNGFAHNGCKLKVQDYKKIFNYQKLVDDLDDSGFYKNHFNLKPFYYSCTMGWDNSSRRNEGFTTYVNYSPKYFYKWLRMIITETRRRHAKDKRLIFVNAWNEWAEGTYLEPDKKYGYTNINTLSKALYDIPYDKYIITDKKGKIK